MNEREVAECVRRAERTVGRGLLAVSGFLGWSLFGWKGVLLAFAAGIGGMLRERQDDARP